MHTAGFTMIEVLVSVVILLVGLLGLAGLQSRSQQAEMESYQRAQALLLLQDMVDRITTNRKVASCYGFTTNFSGGTPYLGALGAGHVVGTPTCTAGTLQEQATAIADLTAWDTALQGAAETTGGSNIGAMIGARGCIAASPIPYFYIVTVTWQGLVSSAAPPSSLTCGKNLYGNENQRRAVSAPVQIEIL